MKVFYASKIKTSSLMILFIALVGLSSCGTYQSAYNEDDDGIYASSVNKNTTENTKTTNKKEYFTKSFEEYMNIQNDDLITDVDDYYSNEPIENDSINRNYSEGSPWGYSNNTSVTIYAGNGYHYPYYNNFYLGFYDDPYYFGSYYYNPWRWRGYYYNPYYYYGYSPYYYGYSPYYYGYSPYYYGSYYGAGYGYPYYSRNHYYRNYDTYGRRTAYNSRRSITNRRNITSAGRRNSNVTSRNSRNTTRRIGDNNNTNTHIRPLTRRTPSRTRTIHQSGGTRNSSGNTRIRRTPTRSSGNTRVRTRSNNSNYRRGSSSTPTRSHRSSSTRSSSTSRSSSSTSHRSLRRGR